MTSAAQAWRSSCRSTTWIPEKGISHELPTQSYLTGDQHGLVNKYTTGMAGTAPRAAGVLRLIGPRQPGVPRFATSRKPRTCFLLQKIAAKKVNDRLQSRRRNTINSLAPFRSCVYPGTSGAAGPRASLCTPRCTRVCPARTGRSGASCCVRVALAAVRLLWAGWAFRDPSDTEQRPMARPSTAPWRSEQL